MRSAVQSARQTSAPRQHVFPVELSRTNHTTEELDARRRLEDRLEEIRLSRDLKEFDFDLTK